MNECMSDWPVIENLVEAGEHDHELPALVPVPGHLVRPILVLTEKLFALEPYGDLARGIELQLVGLAEPDSSCILTGIRDATAAAAKVVKTPDEVAVEAAEEDACPEAIRSHPHLFLLRGGSEEVAIIEADEDTLQ